MQESSEPAQFPDSGVIDRDVQALLLDLEAQYLSSLLLTTHELPEDAAKLPYASARVFAYAQQYCAGGNDCPDGTFPLDCTHFMCHCLNATNVRLTQSTTQCRSGLCIRVNDLAAAFDNSVKKFSNVKRLSSHSEARRGDFCFIPGWFGLSKEHVMLLAGSASPKGAMVYAHTNNRCGKNVDFEGEDCIYYRIEDA